MSPAVSVLLTSYNRPRYLADAINSVLEQTMTDWELIILDDGSTNFAVAQDLGSFWDHPQVIIYKARVAEEERAAKCRYAVQCNTGLRLASGRYITYLCDDDWYAPGRLEIMAATLDADPAAGVAYGRQVITDVDGNPLRERGESATFRVPETGLGVDHSSFMHIADAGSKVGGWDESPACWRIGDAVFLDRLRSAGYSFHLAGDEPLDFHRDHVGVNKLGGPY